MVSRADLKGIYEGAKAGAACALVTAAIALAVTRTCEFVSDFVSEKYASFKSSGGSKVRPGGLPKRRPGDDGDDH